MISIDGWVTINYAASTSSTPLGTVQVILAVGTTKQINNLKKSKSLQFSKNFLRLPNELFAMQANPSCPSSTPLNACEKTKEDSTKPALPQLSSERHTNLAAMFNNFIDNLASRLPERHLVANETAATNDATTQTQTNSKCNSNSSVAVNQTAKYMRPTSDLLDELQKALAIAPTPAQRISIPHAAVPQNQPTPESNIVDVPKSTMFPVHIEIESALHLPSISVHVNKKSGKRNRNSVNSAKKTVNASEIQPSTYATFEASASAATSNSMSYATNIVENSCGPQWNKHFEVYLPVEFLLNVSYPLTMSCQKWIRNFHQISIN